ncbi:MAG: DNA-formamidopyrimidine glycosylase family protein [Cellulomonas sp.]
MPEGDILRRTARRLDQALAGEVLARAEVRWPTAVEVDLVGRTVLGTVSYGKHLLTRFDDERTLHTHLRMEGSWGIARTGAPAAAARGAFVRVVLGTGTWTAIGTRIGMLDVIATRLEQEVIGHLGPDLLDPTFPEAGLAEALRRWRSQGAAPVAEVLLDQRVVAGIGTIYAAESLFARRLWPWTPADEILDPAVLLQGARALMVRSVAAPSPTATGDIARGRTTLVHGRQRQPCRRCGATILVGRAFAPPVDRPIFFCPRCQAPPG